MEEKKERKIRRRPTKPENKSVTAWGKFLLEMFLYCIADILQFFVD